MKQVVSSTCLGNCPIHLALGANDCLPTQGPHSLQSLASPTSLSPAVDSRGHTCCPGQGGPHAAGPGRLMGAAVCSPASMEEKSLPPCRWRPLPHPATCVPTALPAGVFFKACVFTSVLQPAFMCSQNLWVSSGCPVGGSSRLLAKCTSQINEWSITWDAPPADSRKMFWL